MTAPAIVTGHTTKADTSGVTSRTINVPTHSAGDLIILAVVTDASSGTITSPAFSDYVFQDRPILTGGGSTVAIATILWKIAGGSEGSTYTIDTSVSERVGAVAFAVSGSNGLIHASTETNGDSGTATVPAITTSVADCLRISIVGADGITQTTPHGTATNHTKLGEAWASSSGAVSVHYKTIATASTDSAETSTLAASEQWRGFSIALAPAAGGPTYTQACGGTLTSSGALTRKTGKALGGTLTSSGALVRKTSKLLAGTVTSAGALVRKTQKILGGTLTSDGSLTRKTRKVLTGTLTSSGALLALKTAAAIALTIATRLRTLTLPERLRALTVKARRALTVSRRY